MTPTFSKEVLYRSPKIIVRKSDTHGWGVFATQDIEPMEILEEVPTIIYHRDELVKKSSWITVYSYGLDDDYVAIPLGYAGLYNHSQTPSAKCNFNSYHRIYTHFALTAIKAGEEIFIDYGCGDPKVFTESSE